MSQELIERLRMEAQMHAQEARTANATIAEIYQLCSGGKGEPGNWHGAEPVRALISERDQLAATLRQQAARVDEGMVERAVAAYRKMTHSMPQTQHDRMRAALEAALSAQPAERQGECLLTLDSGFQIPIVRKGDGYVPDPRFPKIEEKPAAPVGVPDGMVLVPQRFVDNVRAASREGVHPRAVPVLIEEAMDALEAAAPSAPQGEG